MKRYMAPLVALVLILGVAAQAQAVPFTITSELTGDNRPGNPDGLDVDVTITGDTTSDESFWVIDLDMAGVHNTAKLLAFYFNLVGDFADYAFSDFDPDGWEVVAGDNANGSGSMDFLFKSVDAPGAPHNEVTNSVNLTFTVTKLAGPFTTADFLNADEDCSSDLLLGCGQLGAHIGSLTAGSGESDSGFALGDYEDPPTSVPEPSSMLLLGFGFSALGLALRRSSTSKAV